MSNQNKKPAKVLSWALPLILFLVLCILIVGLKLIKIIRQPFSPSPFSLPPAKVSKISKLFSHQEKYLAIIIDDIGWSLNLANQLAEMEQPLTLAILPFASQTKACAARLRKAKNKELLLHLPLEAKLPAVCHDQGLLKLEMTAEEIREQLEKDLEAIGEPVEGVNNHMGSLFTTDEEKMKILLEAIKQHGLYFVDSMTATNSCGYHLAKNMGVPAARRDVFLDNSSNPEDIREQLFLAVRLARKYGQALAIGHARKETIQVLAEQLPFLEPDIQLVLVSKILQ